MPRSIAAFITDPIRSSVCLIGFGMLFLLLGGVGMHECARGGADFEDLAPRHLAARGAVDHLSQLRTLVPELGLALAAAPRTTLETRLRIERAELGARMIALREIVRQDDELIALRDGLATLAPYTAAWNQAREAARIGNLADAQQALDRAAALGDRALSALATLSHVIDDSNRLTAIMYQAAENWRHLATAGLALLAAGALLFWRGRWLLAHGKPTAAAI